MIERGWSAACVWTALCLPAAGAQAGEMLHVFTGGGSAGPGLGQAVAAAGDVNRDGFDDVIVGFRSGSAAGRAEVFSGADGALLLTLVGGQSGDLFGQAVDGAGDVNGDGHADLIVGAANADAPELDSGAAYVYSGRDGALLYTFSGDFARAHLGGAVSGAGDVNGDGFADVIVGGQPDPNTPRPNGHARVLSGADGTLLLELVGSSGASRLGCAVDGAGDVDGDGTPDLLVGDWRAGSSVAASGAASVFSGADGSLLLTVSGTRPHDRMGLVVSALGDLDGDGRADLLMASPWADGVSADVGRVQVHSGADGALLLAIHGDASYDFFGAAAAGVGDFDGDGTPDFAVGAPWDDDGGSGAGSLRVYSGADGSLRLRMDGDTAGDELGFSVAGAGDVSGRGAADVVLGAPHDDQGGGPASGAAFVLAGVAPEPGSSNYCTPGPNAFGPGAVMGVEGSPSVAAGDLVLTVSGARPGGHGVFFFGAGEQATPFMKGTLCVTAPFHRMGPPVQLDPAGAGALGLAECRWPWDRDLLVAGSSWNFQFVYLDPPARGVGPFNLSDALHLTLTP